MRMSAWRRSHRTIAIVVEAVFRRTAVELWTRTDLDNHPRLVAIAVPAETHWLKVFECGEAEEFIVHFVVRHHRVQPIRIHTDGRKGDGNSLDPTGRHSHIFLDEEATIVGIEINVHVSFVCIVPNVLDIIVDGNRIGVVGQHGL